MVSYSGKTKLVKKDSGLKRTILLVFGTRPEAIKMAPIAKAIQRESDKFNLVTCVTGQHREILDQMLNFFELEPDIDLDLMAPNQSLTSLTAKSIEAVTQVLLQVKPDVTLVQGDTTTAMVAALACFYNKIPIGHVEAGLRTANRYDPFPEEINRRLLSVLATFHFAPTEGSLQNLLKEGHSPESVFLTGNTVIDALLWTAEKVSLDHRRLSYSDSRYILVTAHRRENFGTPINNICSALKRLAERNNIEIVYPVHPNPNIKENVYSTLEGVKGIHLIEPLIYQDFVACMKGATLLLTDSGGVQEEGPSLGKPVLVMRKTTERPEAIEAGVAKLIGTDPDDIVFEVERILNNKDEYERMAKSSNPFGDGTASDRIVKILDKKLLKA